MAATTKAGQAVPAVPAVVVWDFDWSLVNDNSDTLVIQRLEGTEGPAWVRGRAAQAAGQIAPGWTALMDSCVSSLWDAGFHREEFVDALEKIPVLSGALEVGIELNYQTMLACPMYNIPHTPHTHVHISNHCLIMNALCSSQTCRNDVCTSNGRASDDSFVC